MVTTYVLRLRTPAEGSDDLRGELEHVATGVVTRFRGTDDLLSALSADRRPDETNAEASPI